MRRITLLIVCIAAVLAIAPEASAIVHDGRSYAIEAALPELDREENPFILRDQWWHGLLKPGKRKAVRHQLFARNEYWFWAGSSDLEAEIMIHIYDEDGKLIETESWQKGKVAGARIKPEKSGSYLIVVTMKKTIDGGEAEWAIVYGYR